MRLAKVNAGHWKDSGSGPGFNKRYEFAEDCVEAGKVAISYLHTEGHPFTPDHTTDEILQWSEEEIKEMYLKKKSEDTGQNVIKVINELNSIGENLKLIGSNLNGF